MIQKCLKAISENVIICYRGEILGQCSCLVFYVVRFLSTHLYLIDTPGVALVTNQTKNPFKSIIMKIKSQFAAKMHEKFELNVGIVFIISLDSQSKSILKTIKEDSS